MTTFFQARPLFPKHDHFFPSANQYVRYSEAVFPLGWPFRAEKLLFIGGFRRPGGSGWACQKNDHYFPSATTFFQARPLFSKRDHFFPSRIDHFFPSATTFFQAIGTCRSDALCILFTPAASCSFMTVARPCTAECLLRAALSRDVAGSGEVTTFQVAQPHRAGRPRH